MKKSKLQLAILAVSALACATTVQANLVTGTIWSLAPLDNFDAIAANLPSAGTPGVTFSVNSPLDFTSFDGPNNTGNPGAYYTIGSWLATGGAFNINYGAGYSPNSTIDQTIMLITGQVTVANGQQFTVTHDDGLTLTIGSQTVINVPGPTPPITTTETYSGPSGTFDFSLIYAEVDGAPAVLQLDLPLTAVPEPTTVLAGVLLLLPFGASTLRILRRNRTA